MQTVCIASNNAHKVEELQAMLGKSFALKTMAEIGCYDDIEEYGKTLEENSHIKARYIFDKFAVATVADDSGLEIFALDGRPGVYSARYAGEHGNHQANMAKVLNELENESNRNAQFRTVISFINIDNECFTFEGIVPGKIILEKRGTGGFGYDPIFVPDGYTETFAELSSEIKNNISHRARAIQKLLAFLQKK
jgi:XTP/dITP diphosphohydrolase